MFWNVLKRLSCSFSSSYFCNCSYDSVVCIYYAISLPLSFVWLHRKSCLMLQNIKIWFSWKKLIRALLFFCIVPQLNFSWHFITCQNSQKHEENTFHLEQQGLFFSNIVTFTHENKILQHLLPFPMQPHI